MWRLVVFLLLLSVSVCEAMQSPTRRNRRSSSLLSRSSSERRKNPKPQRKNPNRLVLTDITVFNLPYEDDGIKGLFPSTRRLKLQARDPFGRRRCNGLQLTLENRLDIEGDPLHGVAKGSLSAQGQAFLAVFRRGSGRFPEYADFFCNGFECRPFRDEPIVIKTDDLVFALVGLDGPDGDLDICYRDFVQAQVRFNADQPTAEIAEALLKRLANPYQLSLLVGRIRPHPDATQTYCILEPAEVTGNTAETASVGEGADWHIDYSTFRSRSVQTLQWASSSDLDGETFGAGMDADSMFGLTSEPEGPSETLESTRLVSSRLSYPSDSRYREDSRSVSNCSIS